MFGSFCVVLLFVCSSFGQDSLDVYESWPFNRTGVSITTNAHLSLFSGGYTSSGDCSDQVDIFHVFNSSWTKHHLSIKRCEHASVSVKDIVLIGGGSNSSSVDVFYTDSKQWKTFRLSHPRNLLTATSNSRYAFFAGGMTSDGNATAIVDIFDSLNNNWTSSSLSYARYDLEAACVVSVCFFGPAQGNNIIDIFDISNQSWTTNTLSTNESEYYTVTSAGNYVMFTSSISRPKIEIYNTLNNTWKVYSLNGISGKNRIMSTSYLNLGVFITDSYLAVIDPSVPRYAFLIQTFEKIPLTCTTNDRLIMIATATEVTSYSFGLCNPGSYSSNRYPPCNPCFPGSFSGIGRNNCTLCAGGWYTPDWNSTECLGCGGGYFSLIGQSNCTSCPPGTFSYSESDMCLSCSAGSYSTGEQAFCTSCPANTYNPNSFATSPDDCLKCERGKCSNLGSSGCDKDCSLDSTVAIAIPVSVFVVVLIAIFGFVIWRRKIQQKKYVYLS